MMNKWEISLRYGLLAFVPNICIVAIGIVFHGNADGLGGIGLLLIMLQILFVVLSITTGKKSINYGDQRGRFGIILAISSFIPMFLLPIII